MDARSGWRRAGSGLGRENGTRMVGERNGWLGSVWMEQHNHLHGLLGSSTIILGDRLLNSSSRWLGWCETIVAKESRVI